MATIKRVDALIPTAEETQIKWVGDNQGDKKFSFSAITSFLVDFTSSIDQFDSRFFSVPINSKKVKIKNIKAYRKMYVLGLHDAVVSTANLESISNVKPMGIDEYLYFGFSGQDFESVFDSTALVPRTTYDKSFFFRTAANPFAVVLKEFQMYNDYKIIDKTYELADENQFLNIFLSIGINSALAGVDGWRESLVKNLALFTDIETVNGVYFRYFIEIDGLVE
jgi:hypothetical protein